MVQSNPAKILGLLDARLTKLTELTVYGRAALVLGFDGAIGEWGATMDVDAILPTSELTRIEADEEFWAALEQVNRELEPSGMYFTHLFEDSQVILRPDWLTHRVEICAERWPHLRLFRPATVDLVLSKMMRVDPQDRADIEFLITQPDFSRETFGRVLDEAIVPPVVEIESAFCLNREWLRSRMFGQ